MKLYEVNQLIASIFDQLVNPDTGEVIPDEALLAQLDSLQMERSRILEYLAKLVLNTKSEVAALKEEEQRLRDRRGGFERKIDRLMAILDRECSGEKTDCGVATVYYRKTTKVDVADGPAAILWLKENGYDGCYKQPAPEVSKNEVKKLLTAGTNVPGCAVVEDYSCLLK